MKKILIIDDEKALLNIFTMEFDELSEFEVFTAESGEEGIHILKKTSVDVLLTDLTMPKMDGIKLLKYIREQKINIACTIVLSGLPKDLHQKELDSLNVAKYFEKPYKVAEIVKFVKKAATNF